ncbi:MAG: Gfo/Idh/MocA family oxidoreductase [Acidobacteria bacterium]|nr:Gfo/Idh/MocA family oxidoreductase [Acidobacteriota bacterium]
MTIEGQKTAANSGGIKYGMIGGGRGSFIGSVHRKAIAMDGLAELAAGCFSNDPENTIETGESLGLSHRRLYGDYRKMIRTEAKHPDKIDFIVIVTPNNSHYPIARLALENGFHVVCDKPLATSIKQARELGALAKKKDLLFAVTYAYTGYPIVRHMREMVAKGDLGMIRFVAAEYPQDWLATLLEKTGQKQSAWRTDPKQAGISNCVGDIGSHIENMVSHVTGLEIRSLLARLDRFGEGRVLDDNASILVEYKGGAKGSYWSSQIAVGHDNGFRVRIYGTKGSLEWAQEDPNYCKVAYVDRPTVRLSRGRDDLYPAAGKLSRLPSGHPEGYFECFANTYSAFALALQKKKAGRRLTAEDLDFPNVDDGIRGVKFIEKCVESSRRGAAWVKF